MTLDEPAPYLIDLNGQEHRLATEAIIIGRAVETDIVITSNRVSREHARIYKKGRHWYVEDLGSTNGTYLNDERVLSPADLHDGDVLMIGDVSFVFHDPDVTSRETPMPKLDVDLPAGVVRLNRRMVSLSPKEFLLLAFLFERRGQVCSKDDIGRAVWPEYEVGGIFDYQIENLVRRLRTHIEVDPAKPQLLFTIRGLGYKLVTG
jgi:hypothetical protein